MMSFRCLAVAFQLAVIFLLQWNGFSLVTLPERPDYESVSPMIVFNSSRNSMTIGLLVVCMTKAHFRIIEPASLTQSCLTGHQTVL